MIGKTGVLPILFLLVSCASILDPPPEIRVEPYTDLAPEQLTALQDTIRSIGFLPDWVDVERRPYQISEFGHDTFLSAQAVKAPRIVAAGLCIGELLPLTMGGSGFDKNLWKASGVEQYAVFSLGVSNPCEEGRRRNARIWIRGQILNDELLGILQTIKSESVESASPSFDSVHLLEGERIISVSRKASAEGFFIEVMTSTGRSQGRLFRFREQDGVWVVHVVSFWIA
jgi:hypothetical protein